jgi:N-acetylglucosamine-6-sulfatase
MLAALEAAGRLDRTVVVVMSDHGYFYGEHDLNEERRLAYEESARIPLIVRYPTVAKPGSTPAELVQTLDLAPTILELAGVADGTPRQGRSLLPLLRGAHPAWRDAVLIEYYSDTVFPRIRNMAYRAIRTGRHKYVRYLELPGMDELYDLESDPYELDNLMGSARGQALLPKLQAELGRLLRESGEITTR